MDQSSPNNEQKADGTSASGNPPAKPPDGVDEQIEADLNGPALHALGLSEIEIHSALRQGVLDQARARKHLPRWFKQGIAVAHCFATLADIKVADGWHFRGDGVFARLTSPNGQYGLVVWPGNANTGDPAKRANTRGPRGANSRSMIDSAQLAFDFGLAPPPAAVAEESIDPDELYESDEVTPEQVDDLRSTADSKAEQPKEYIIILRRIRGMNVQSEVQILQAKALSPNGYIVRTRLRILLHDFVVREAVVDSSEPRQPVAPPDLDVPVEPRESEAPSSGISTLKNEEDGQ